MGSEIQLMIIFLTILSGVFVFVLGQITLKLFVDPWQKQRECISMIAHHLLLYANVYANPGTGTDDINNEASTETRKLAAELIASCKRIPFYNALTKIKLFPTMEVILKVQKHLVGLSNSTHNGDPLANASRSDNIKILLGIEYSD